MCGIIAFLGDISSYNYILEGIKMLQNRGYDSAGICLYNENFNIYKFITDNKSAINKMESSISNFDINCNIGIGHTRWATHGNISVNNCHPHISEDGNICLIHNGIIENYKEIKEYLINKGFIFYSDTDTEVICNLISYYNKYNNILTSIKKTIKVMTGTWGLVILIKGEKRIYFTRKGSPLLLGVNNNDNFAIITSEKSGFCNRIEDYIVLDNNDICFIENKANKINFFSEKSLIENDNNYLEITSKLSNNFENNIINYDYNISEEIYLHSQKIYKKINNILFNEDNTPGEFIYWTLKEIEEQKISSLRALSMGGRISNGIKLGGLEKYSEELKNIDNIIFLGCGTSFNAGHFASYYYKENNIFNIISVIDGADFNVGDIPNYGKTCCIFLSQSGETLDLIRCLEICKKKNILTLGVVNVVDSSIARETDCGCYLNAGREVGVASTKAFTSQIIVLLLIRLFINKAENKNILLSLKKIHIDIEKIINSSRNKIRDWVNKLVNKKSIFILGKDECYSISREAALKIKEISYIHAEASPASSLKHGPFGLLEVGFPVILIDIGEKNRSKMLNVYNEIKCRGAEIFTITDELNCQRDNIFIIDSKSEFNNLLSIIPLQFLSFYLSIEKKINPDFPRNLAKVVTVE